MSRDLISIKVLAIEDRPTTSLRSHIRDLSAQPQREDEDYWFLADGRTLEENNNNYIDNLLSSICRSDGGSPVLGDSKCIETQHQTL